MAALMKAMLLLNRQNPNLRAQSTGNSMTRLDKGQIMTWRGDGHKMNFAGFIFRLWYLSHVYPLIDKPCLWSQKKHLYEIWPVGMRTRKKRPPSIGTRISEQRVRDISDSLQSHHATIVAWNGQRLVMNQGMMVSNLVQCIPSNKTWCSNSHYHLTRTSFLSLQNLIRILQIGYIVILNKASRKVSVCQQFVCHNDMVYLLHGMKACGIMV